jgi:hypothetical protein
MKPWFALSAAAWCALAGCTTAAPQGRYALRPTAEPSTVISTELAFARAAREKGQWSAFRAFATKDALWAAPDFESVQAALKGEAGPAQAIVWEPDRVWSSCDGSFAVSSGPATFPSGRKTRFVTVWQRQDDGQYRWVLDGGFDLEANYQQPEMIAAAVADCPARDPHARMARKAPKARRGDAWQSGRSDDGTLAWTSTMTADCVRSLTVAVRKGEAMETVFQRTATPPPPREGALPPRCAASG